MAERLERLEQIARGVAPQAPEAEAKPKGKPNLADFQNYEDFSEALADWKFEQRMAERDEQTQRQALETAQNAKITKHVQGFRDRMGKALQADPELLDRVDHRLLELQTSFQAMEDGRGVGPGEVIADLYTASEHGPAILLHLTEHPEEVVRLIRCENPIQLAMEFGKIEARIAAAAGVPAPATPKRTTSNAPPPLRPLSTSATESEPDFMGEISFDEFKRRAGKRR